MASLDRMVSTLSRGLALESNGAACGGLWGVSGERDRDGAPTGETLLVSGDQDGAKGEAWSVGVALIPAPEHSSMGWCDPTAQG